MDLELRRTDPSDDDDVGAMLRWANDDRIRHFTTFFADAEAVAQRRTIESIRRQLAKDNLHHYLVWVDGRRVGEVSFVVDARQLHRAEPGSAWLGITIGEASLRGRGVGRESFVRLEDLCREAGCPRAELGVFEYNERARAFYERAGYQRFAELRDFTYWNGRRWSDLRYEKVL